MPKIDSRSPSPVAKGVDKALSDGKVTASEVRTIVKAAREDGVTTSERRQLSFLADRNADKFDPKARAAVAAFAQEALKTEFAGAVAKGALGGLQDPAAKDSTVVDWTGAKGELFVKGPSADDVVQGSLGDCYLLAVLSSAAQQQPELIKELIRKNEDGTYTATFYQRGEKQEVTIDGDLPTRGEGYVYARSRDGEELWVPLIEKAYASWRRSYGAIGMGGDSGQVIAQLTGREAASLWFDRVPASDHQDLLAAIAAGLKKGDLATASTGTRRSREDLAQAGLVPSHAYSLLGIEKKDGETFVRLRNPWGEIEPSGDGKDDGTFLLTSEQFFEHFEVMHGTAG